MEAKDRIIVALDVPDLKGVKKLVKELAPYVGMFKVGLQLIGTGEALEAIEIIAELKGKVMYDGKFLDTPRQIEATLSRMRHDAIKMYTVHASGGIKMMNRARMATSPLDTEILACTVLTSLSEEEVHEIFGAPSKATVLKFARWAELSGLDGVVCSAKELVILGKQKELRDLKKVIPGIRPIWATEKGDHERTATPAEAIEMGADLLVIGSPITQPPAEIGSPVEAAKKIAEEIATVM